MDQNSPDYQAILEHIKMKSEAGDSYASMIAYLARKEVPEAEATEIIRTVTAEQQAKKAAEAPARRKAAARPSASSGTRCGTTSARRTRSPPKARNDSPRLRNSRTKQPHDQSLIRRQTASNQVANG